jgi:CSLREA domain-containing protein
MARRAVIMLVSVLLVPRGLGAFTVTTTDDAHDATPGDGVCADAGGDCTLRAAVEEIAATAAPPPTMTVDVPAGSYAITLGDLSPSCSSCAVTIQGAGAGVTEIDADSAGAAFMTSTPITLDGLGLRHLQVSGTSWLVSNCEISDVTGVALKSPQLDVAIQDSTITRVERALDVSFGTVAIDRVQITNCTSNPAVRLDNAHADIRDSEITDNPQAYAVDGIAHTVRVERSTIARNVGGIVVCTLGGSAEIIDSTVTDHAYDGISGAAVYVEGTRVARNGVHGVYVDGFCTPETAHGTVRRSVIHNNLLGIAALGNGLTLDVEDSVVASNAGYGIGTSNGPAGGTTHVNRSWITTNQGPGVLLTGSRGQPLVATIDASTISDNHAFDGAGVELAAYDPYTSPGGAFLDLTITNTTISGNHSDDSGAGLFVGDSGAFVRLNGCTIARNATQGGTTGGGGVKVRPANTVVVRNTIIADNTDASGIGPDCAGAIVSEGHDLLENATGCTVSGDTTGNLVGVDPALAPLADYGGPTPTHALFAGSPVIDAGDPGTPGSGGTACAATDQRGIVRPEGAACDIGAVEDTCANGTPDEGEPCSCPPQPEDVCTTTTTSTITTTTTTGTTLYTTTTTVSGSTSTTTTTMSTITTTTTTGTMATISGSTTTTTMPFAACPAQPSPSCTPPPHGALLTARNRTPDTRDRLHWGWSVGRDGDLPAAALGDPATTAYAFCVYADGALRTGTLIPAGATCDGRPCWWRRGAVLKYIDLDAARAGIRRIVVRPSPGPGHLSVDGVGAGLGLGPATPWPAPVDVQLRTGTGSCFGATFSAPRTNDGESFGARSR